MLNSVTQRQWAAGGRQASSSSGRAAPHRAPGAAMQQRHQRQQPQQQLRSSSISSTTTGARRGVRVLASTEAEGAAAAGTAEPTVTIKFVERDPKAAAGAGSTVEVAAPSGEQLRFTMMESKVDLYTTWGKIWSCGGAGQCGTCIVAVEGGDEALLSERTATEERKLKGKPANWRLACQTIVGDGENSGSVVIATKPQQ